jgi:hypothetical protein
VEELVKRRNGTRRKTDFRWVDVVSKDFIKSHLDILPKRFFSSSVFLYSMKAAFQTVIKLSK